MTHANERLMQLTVKNAQRLAAASFISELPSGPKLELGQADCIFYPELSALVAPVVHLANRAHDRRSAPSAGAHVSFSSSWDKSWKHFQDWTHRLPAGSYVLVVGGGNGQSFDKSVSWVSTLPGYLVQVPPILQWLAQMPVTGSELLLSSKDGEHAVVLQASGGFLKDEPSLHEVVYETTAWGLA